MTRAYEPSASIAYNLYVEFDNQQVEVATNISEVADHVAITFQHMLGDGTLKPAGKITVAAVGSGYELLSAETRTYQANELMVLLDAVREEVRVQFMRARPDLLWLHAASVERDGLALIISGASGQGKSTISTLLTEKGWRLMSDDVAPTSMDADVVLPFPLLPRRRTYPGKKVEAFNVGSLAREAIHIGPAMYSQAGAAIGAIVFVKFEDCAQSTLDRLTPGESVIQILRNTVNFVDHKELAVLRAIDWAKRVQGFALTYSAGQQAADLLSALKWWEL